jgi:hypothetical protein
LKDQNKKYNNFVDELQFQLRSGRNLLTKRSISVKNEKRPMNLHQAVSTYDMNSNSDREMNRNDSFDQENYSTRSQSNNQLNTLTKSTADVNNKATLKIDIIHSNNNFDDNIIPATTKQQQLKRNDSSPKSIYDLREITQNRLSRIETSAVPDWKKKLLEKKKQRYSMGVE